MEREISEGESFAVCLGRLMEIREHWTHKCKGACLAKAIHTDGSNVRSWLQSYRTPKLDSEHIGNIIEHLNLTDAESQDLLHAQVKSLRIGNKPRPHRSANKKKPPVERLVKRGLHPSGSASDVPPTPRRGADKQSKGILEEVAALLESLPDGTGRDDDSNTITLTWQGRDDAFELNQALHLRWQAALQSLLRRGWRIHHLCRLDKNAHRTVRLVEMMLDLFGAGAYYPYYFTTYGTLAAPYDLLVIPGTAAVWLFSAHSEHSIDAGIVMRDIEQIRSVTAHARHLAAQTKPLVRAYFSDNNDTSLLKAICDAESHSGGRVNVKDGLSLLTEPEKWCEENATMWGAVPITLEDLHALINYRKRRITDFNRHIDNYDYLDICTDRAIERLIRDGSYPRDEILSLVQQDKKTCLEHLRNVVSMLQRHARYHFAHVDEYQVSDIGPEGIQVDAIWEVTGDNSVFLETWVLNYSGQPVEVSLHITEPIVAEGFREYFRQMWERIPPPNREKADVIKWLEGKIAELERDIAEAGE